MLKILTMIVLAVSVAVPAFAGEMTKGGKSYQTRSNINQQSAATNAPQTGEDVSKIAPAAGDQAPSGEQGSSTSEGKTLREEMRLPRKN